MNMNRRMSTGLRLPVLLPAIMLLCACQGIPANIPTDPTERVTIGDRVQIQRELTIPAQNASVILQHGRIVTGAADRFEASCRFVMKAGKNEPQMIAPDE
ncbi:MAG: hypothetical protein SV201_00850, partial [Pseudomonadota bacterium]|nr:hypothetical protein [Pseudomonadota bacterium]